MDAKEKNSLTAKDAKGAKERVLRVAKAAKDAKEIIIKTEPQGRKDNAKGKEEALSKVRATITDP
jgi:hypothetical protein